MRGGLLSGEATRPCVAACCRARSISEFREFNEFRDVRAMPATNQVSDVIPLNRAARSLTSLNSLISLNSQPTARYHDAPKRDEFVVRRASDTTLGEFRVDGLYLDVLPIDEIIR